MLQLAQMPLESYHTKPSVIVVYTGDSKGKTSASLGLMCRALGNGWKVAYIQFIKHWEVGEHKFIRQIEPVFGNQLYFYKGGKGFYDAGDLSARDVSNAEHMAAAQNTYKQSLHCTTSGNYDLVICDEINNAVHDGLLAHHELSRLIDDKHTKTSLCLTGRNFPTKLLTKVDIATDMFKIKHHFDDNFMANEGIDY
jgi:cob(I)alamin adenosyltransferase